MSYAQLEQQLTDLHLASIRKQYQTLAQQAAQANWSFETYLAQLIDQEFQRRTMNRRQRRIKDAKFPLSKELADFLALEKYLNSGDHKEKLQNLLEQEKEENKKIVEFNEYKKSKKYFQ